MYQLISKVRSFRWRITTTCHSLKELLSNDSLYRGDCYFPEQGNRKSEKRIFFEQLIHVLKNKYCNKFYFLYGFDIKGFRKEDDYVDYTQFMRKRNALNYASPTNPIAVLRDKYLFGVTASAYGINTPPILGMISNGDDLFLSRERQVVSLKGYLSTHSCDLFLKVTDGECADGVFHIIGNTKTIKQAGKVLSICDFISTINKNTRYILQERVSKQHSAIDAIYTKAINTIRLVTVIEPLTQKPCVFSAVLRCGKGESEVDNWAAGGLSIGINTQTGELAEYGFYKPGFGTKANKHPDSGIPFKGYKIPFLKQAIEEAIRFHELLKGIHSIGWDIAITETGPCFIEGNDNWEISLMQISNHGLAKEFYDFFLKK